MDDWQVVDRLSAEHNSTRHLTQSSPLASKRVIQPSDGQHRTSEAMRWLGANAFGIGTNLCNGQKPQSEQRFNASAHGKVVLVEMEAPCRFLLTVTLLAALADVFASSDSGVSEGPHRTKNPATVSLSLPQGLCLVTRSNNPTFRRTGWHSCLDPWRMRQERFVEPLNAVQWQTSDCK